MVYPVNIATTLAKKKAKREAFLVKVATLDKEIAELENKQ